MLPRAQEAGQCSRFDRLHLFTQPGQRAASQLAQHLGLAPLRARASGAELAVQDPALGGKSLQRVAGDGRAEAESLGHLVGRERSVGAGVPGHQVGQRIVDRLGEDIGRAGRHRHAEPVTQPAHILDDSPTLDPRHPDLDHPSGRDQGGEGRAVIGAVDAALGHLVGRQGAEQADQVDDALGVAGPTVGCEALELCLDLDQHLGIEQFAQLGPAEQLGKQTLVEGEGGRATLGDGGVALVDELGDVAEEQAPCVRRRGRRGDVGDLHLAPVDRAHQGRQRR